MPQVRSYFLKIKPLLQKIWDFIYSFRKILIIWAILTIFVIISIIIGWDKKAVAFMVILIGLISQAFIGLINIIALIPIIGPLIAKVLALPIYWILNALGYFVSLIAIKKGYSRDVINYRMLTIVFLVGVAVGFIIGNLI